MNWRLNAGQLEAQQSSLPIVRFAHYAKTQEQKLISQSKVRRSDLFVAVICNRKNGRWAWEISGHKHLARMGCGFLHSGTRHTLLAFGLASALKSITKTACGRVLVSNREATDVKTARDNGRKLKVAVKCSDLDFLKALEHSINQEAGTRKRSAANVLDALLKEIDRFDLSFIHVEEIELNKIKHWAERVLPQSRFQDGFPMPEALRSLPETIP